MTNVRPFLAAAASLLVIQTAAAGANLLPAGRRIEEVVDHYIGQALKKAAVTPRLRPMMPQSCADSRSIWPVAFRPRPKRAYIQSADRDKRARMVDHLMASPSFVQHQVDELDAMLMAGGRNSLRDYLVTAVGENRAWDRVFREIMLPDQIDKTQKSAAVYLRQGLKDLDRLTADVSSTFFGVNISCAQCHDHPLVPDWKQDHFYGMKAFFSRTFETGRGSENFLGEHGYGEVRFKTTDDIERKAHLMFLTGRRVDEPGAKEPGAADKKKEKEALERAKKAKVPPPPPSFRRGPSWSSWPLPRPSASSLRAPSSIASGIASSAMAS